MLSGAVQLDRWEMVASCDGGSGQARLYGHYRLSEVRGAHLLARSFLGSVR
jgi:hypothetical protein